MPVAVPSLSVPPASDTRKSAVSVALRALDASHQQDRTARAR